MNITTAIHLDTRRAKEENTYPIKLRVTYQRERKYYRTGFSLTKEDWKKLNSQKPRGELKEIKIKTSLILDKADNIIKGIDEFSFFKFEKEFFKAPKKILNVKGTFEDYISKLNKEGRISTASSYQTALNSLMEFKGNLKFWDITPDFLLEYEKWMTQEGNSMTTVGIYLRNLRTLINNTIEDGNLKREYYPFGKRKYQIPSSHNVKKALTTEEISKIYYSESLAGSSQDKAKDFWLFSYLANGMNMKDICRLKYENIEGDRIIFIRAKTARTKKSNQ